MKYNSSSSKAFIAILSIINTVSAVTYPTADFGLVNPQIYIPNPFNAPVSATVNGGSLYNAAIQQPAQPQASGVTTPTGGPASQPANAAPLPSTPSSSAQNNGNSPSPTGSTAPTSSPAVAPVPSSPATAPPVITGAATAPSSSNVLIPGNPALIPNQVVTAPTVAGVGQIPCPTEQVGLPSGGTSTTYLPQQPQVILLPVGQYALGNTGSPYQPISAPVMTQQPMGSFVGPAPMPIMNQQPLSNVPVSIGTVAPQSSGISGTYGSYHTMPGPLPMQALPQQTMQNVLPATAPIPQAQQNVMTQPAMTQPTMNQYAPNMGSSTSYDNLPYCDELDQNTVAPLAVTRESMTMYQGMPGMSPTGVMSPATIQNTAATATANGASAGATNPFGASQKPQQPTQADLTAAMNAANTNGNNNLPAVDANISGLSQSTNPTSDSSSLTLNGWVTLAATILATLMV